MHGSRLRKRSLHYGSCCFRYTYVGQCTAVILAAMDSLVTTLHSSSSNSSWTTSHSTERMPAVRHFARKTTTCIMQVCKHAWKKTNKNAQKVERAENRSGIDDAGAYEDIWHGCNYTTACTV